VWAGGLGAGRETVRLAAGVLQREGLLVKIRRRGTFLRPQAGIVVLKTDEPRCLGYLQTDYPTTPEEGDEAVTSVISGLMLQGALAEASQEGFQILVQHASHTQLQEAVRRLCQGGRLHGVVFASCGHEKAIRSAVGLGMSIVLLDHDMHLPNVSSVRDDSFEGARMAVRHLAWLGHRRIGLVHWQQADLNPWRLRGYRQGLRDAGLPRRQSWELPIALTHAGARQAAERFESLSPRPTALYCFNNTLARLVIEELARRSVHVPEDVSVMGAGGEEVPGLTCTAIDWHEMGRAAVRMLQAVSGGKDTPEHRLLPHTLRTGRTAIRLQG